MHLNHIHVAVRDLSGALDWLERVWQVKAQFQNERMATLIFGEFTLILDAAEADSSATIGFESDDCDRDFRLVGLRQDDGELVATVASGDVRASKGRADELGRPRQDAVTEQVAERVVDQLEVVEIEHQDAER